MKRLARELAFALLVIILAGHSVSAAASDTGMFLIHGKWGSPQRMSALAKELASRGYLVSNAEFPGQGGGSMMWTIRRR